MKLAIIIIIGIAIIISVGVLNIDNQKPDDVIFHATLADPELYVEGVFSEEFFLESGYYKLRFVPNGDSPEVLSVYINGESELLHEDFELSGTPHITEISEYYTWEYIGKNTIYAVQSEMVRITIDPHGDLLGPVSVSLIRE